MPDEMTVKGAVFRELEDVGYNRDEAWWIADQWAPQFIGYQWSGGQLVDWLYDSGLITTIIDPNKPIKRVPAPEPGKRGEWVEVPNIVNVPGAARSAINQYRAAMGQEQVMAANQQAMERAGMAPWQIEDELIRQRGRQIMEAQRRQQEAQRRQQEAERFGELAERVPTAAEITAPFLEQARGVSPAFQRVAEQRLLPDIFAELGMPQRRRQWWETGARSIAQQLLPETAQEKELMALKRTDPWAQLLAQPTFLQQLETRFRGLSPSEKGISIGRFRPRTRFII